MSDTISAASQLKFAPPKVGVVATPPKRNVSISDTLDISKAKAPKEIKRAGAKKRKNPINIVNFLWLGALSISAAIGGTEIFRVIRKH